MNACKALSFKGPFAAVRESQPTPRQPEVLQSPFSPLSTPKRPLGSQARRLCLASLPAKLSATCGRFAYCKSDLPHLKSSPAFSLQHFTEATNITYRLCFVATSLTCVYFSAYQSATRCRRITTIDERRRETGDGTTMMTMTHTRTLAPTLRS